MKNKAFESLKEIEFRWYLFSRFFLTLSTQITEVVVAWQIYQITNDPLSLGFVGLFEAIPSIAISLYGGHLADSFNRKVIIQLNVFLLLLCTLAILACSYNNILNANSTWYLYAIIFVSGIARGMLGPALFSFWPQLVPNKKVFINAVTMNSTVWQISSTVGPAIGGLLIAPIGINHTYFVATIMMFISLIGFSMIGAKPMPEKNKNHSFWDNISEGIKFVFKNQIILSALTLDLFAVLFGGAVALLPVYARDILHVGAFEFGILKAATPIGAIFSAIFIAFFPLQKNIGVKMLWSVAAFGVCIIGFGFSTYLWLSFFLLLMSGVFDGISVVIRGTMVQTITPDYMKGRVSAVNNIFIGSSNEIGAFESGFAARLLGPVVAVVAGGFVSLGVVAITAMKADKLRNYEN